MSRLIDLTGQRFGSLTVIKRDNNIGKMTAWKCACDCGRIVTVRGDHLKKGEITSCGKCQPVQRRIDLRGKQFGDLTVVDFAPSKNGQARWKCLCKCGNTCIVNRRELITGETTSCGCKVKEDLTGKRFGRLVVYEDTGKRDANQNRIWLCDCDCGGTKEVTTHDLNHGFVRSCGCLAEDASEKAGENLGNYVIKNHVKEGTNIKNLTSKISKSNTSGVKGITWDAAKKKWVAQISFKKKHYHLGRYDNKEDAIKIRKAAEEELFDPIIEKYKDVEPTKPRKRGGQKISDKQLITRLREQCKEFKEKGMKFDGANLKDPVQQVYIRRFGTIKAALEFAGLHPELYETRHLEAEDLTGQRFGKLIVMRQIKVKVGVKNGRDEWRTMNVCRCDCGGIRVCQGFQLRGGQFASCGCDNKKRGPKKNKD